MTSTNRSSVQAIEGAVRGAVLGASLGGKQLDQHFAEQILKYIFDRIKLISGTEEQERLRTQVYVCYSSSEVSTAEKLTKELLMSGHRVWFDRFQMKPGDSLQNRIEQSISESAWFLVLLSKNSVASNWCRHELSVALELELRDQKIKVVPVLVEDADIPILLRDRVYADLRNGNWDVGMKQIVDLLA